jgi:hypothetical protein
MLSTVKSTVHLDWCAVDIGTRVRCKKTDHLRDLIRFPHAAHGNGFDLLRANDCIGHVGCNPSGAYAIHEYPFPGDFAGERFAGRNQRALGCCIVRLSRLSGFTSETGQKYKAAPTLLNHVRKKGFVQVLEGIQGELNWLDLRISSGSSFRPSYTVDQEPSSFNPVGLPVRSASSKL